MNKQIGIVYSEAIWSLVDAYLPSQIDNAIYLQTFNNCREQGFMTVIYDLDMVIWTFANRHTDQASVIIGTHKNIDNINMMYDEEAWKNEKRFNTVDDAAHYIVKALIAADEQKQKEEDV